MDGPTMVRSMNCSSFDRSLGTCYFQKLGADFEELLEGVHSDIVITVQGKPFRLHRCVLSVRCSFFRNYFHDKQTDIDLSDIVNLEKLGSDAFTAVIKYVYGGRIRPFGNAAPCMDMLCSHDTCWPAVEFALDFLRAACVFRIPELKSHAELHLVGLVDKVPAEYVLDILLVARTHEIHQLQVCCLDALANSNWDLLNLEKRLPEEYLAHIKALRVALKIVEPSGETNNEKQIRRVRWALDSDDVELVTLLLEEKSLSLDEAYGLHYASAHCDEKTIGKLLDLGIADPNAVDKRGLTVLHTAAMRREPEVLASLLDKGACTQALTPDGRSALQMVRRVTKKGISTASEAVDEQFQKDKLCIEILEQAEKKIAYSKAARDMLNPAVGEKELVMKLLYLENRVALARVLFPREAKIAMGIAHLEATSEFTGTENRCTRPVSCGKESPAQKVSPGNDILPSDVEARLHRVNALQRTVELGHRFFPRCSAILNKYMDDDCNDGTFVEKVPPEVYLAKKRRYKEIKEFFAEAFTKDVAEMDKKLKTKPSHFPPCLSSSSSSQSDSPVT